MFHLKSCSCCVAYRLLVVPGEKTNQELQTNMHFPAFGKENFASDACFLKHLDLKYNR